MVSPVLVDEGLSFLPGREALLEPATAALDLRLCRGPVRVYARYMPDSHAIVLRLPRLRCRLVRAFQESFGVGKRVEFPVWER